MTVVMTVAAMPTSAQVSTSSQEERVKAAFIYQFTNYIVWPGEKEATTPSHAAFIITVVGKSALVDELSKLAQTKKIKGRPIEIVITEDPGKIVPSQIVIINTSDAAVLLKIAGKLKNNSSLIVSHGTDFAKKGAMINFFVEDERLRFEINRTFIAQAKLQVGSQLLSLAKLVD